jgi:hypothetical protein
MQPSQTYRIYPHYRNDDRRQETSQSLARIASLRLPARNSVILVAAVEQNSLLANFPAPNDENSPLATSFTDPLPQSSVDYHAYDLARTLLTQYAATSRGPHERSSTPPSPQQQSLIPGGGLTPPTSYRPQQPQEMAIAALTLANRVELEQAKTAMSVNLLGEDFPADSYSYSSAAGASTLLPAAGITTSNEFRSRPQIIAAAAVQRQITNTQPATITNPADEVLSGAATPGGAAQNDGDTLLRNWKATASPNTIAAEKDGAEDSDEYKNDDTLDMIGESCLERLIKKLPYFDGSTLEDPTSLASLRRRTRAGVKEPFPDKLYRMLMETMYDGKQDIASFYPHGRAFGIHKSEEFVEEILPKYFNQSKLSSFQRQLNIYGFGRVQNGHDAGGYYHELFL